MQSSLTIIDKINVGVTFDPTVPFMIIYFRKTPVHVPKKTCLRVFVAELFVLAKNFIKNLTIQQQEKKLYYTVN